MGSIAGLVLGVTTFVAGVGVLGALVAAFFSVGAWGVVVAVWFGLTAISGWRIMQMLMRTGNAVEALNNSLIAVTMTLTVFLFAGITVLLDPPTLSAWWGLLTPVAYIALTILLPLPLGLLLDLVNKSGRA